MTLIELKKSIHKKVDELDDPELLELVNSVLRKKDDVFIIPEHMKAGIKEGEEDIKNGDYITLEEFEKRYEQWLKD
ncbi:hypothetical protein EWM62_15405 [Mucilaginibacter terrigena]|uniref:Uncharacterized protein n=1 Tax=Mucilaginibacter terrigena TaxID=2492395 RepID=A0A4Q5LI89_9SPHI|nr:hypothetical protein [Mucilaginibacter terrigena]RYU87880.1 hypothetical protein EWM62_15405 [Mucilaginibacter terrigena]